jgi:Fe-S-cluster containining protein
MICLRCGWCCENISPVNTGKCKHLSFIDDGIAECAIYENRPMECYKHDFPARVCPIGKQQKGSDGGAV